jgi:hypothetical protein
MIKIQMLLENRGIEELKEEPINNFLKDDQD